VRLIFLGSPSFAVPSLDALREAGHEIGLVVTQPDRPSGRGQKPTPPAVAAYAREHALPVWQTSSLKGTETEARLREVGAEAMALAAFAALVPGNVLALAPLGILNVHPSLLPRWRGAAPIQSALLAGDTETGVSIIRLVQALDAGPVLLQERTAIAPEDDYLTLEPRLAAVGGRLLVRALAERPQGAAQDDSAATYSRRIERDDARIDWSLPAERIWNQVRGYRAWPQAFTTFGGRQLKILRAWPLGRDGGDILSAGEGFPAGRDQSPAQGTEIASAGTVSVQGGVPVVQTGAGLLRLDEVQLEGKRAQSGADFLRGYPSLNGAKLA
jgi:methionyl-tRNA formyltransferase